MSRAGVHALTGQAGAEYELSWAALVTVHAWPPTVTTLLLAVSEKPKPLSVRVSPGLAVVGEMESSTGVSASLMAKVQPPATKHTAVSTATVCELISAMVGKAGAGGGEGGGGEGGGEGGGGEGGGAGGGFGGGDGASRATSSQSRQSVPYSHAAYSLPGPPSSQIPSLTQPCSAHALLQTSGGGGGEGGGIEGGGGGGGLNGGDGGIHGEGGEGGGERGDMVVMHS